MAAGRPSQILVEVEWTPGAWTDETARVDLAAGIRLKGGRPTPYDDTAPSTLDVSFRNSGPDAADVGRFTPDSPLSALYPNVVEDKRIRVWLAGPNGNDPSLTRIFSGFIDSYSPVLDPDLGKARVEVSASDVLARLNRRTMASNMTERARLRGSTLGDAVDVWPMTGGVADSRELPNVGTALAGSGRVLQPARILQPKNGDVGSWSVGEADGPIALDGAVRLEPSGTTALQGPLVWLHLQATGPGSVGFWFRADSPDWTPAARACLASFYTDGLNLVGSVELASYVGGAGLQWRDADGVAGGQIMGSSLPLDGQWHYLAINRNGVDPSLCSVTWTVDLQGRRGAFSSVSGLNGLRDVRHIVLGGRAVPNSRGLVTVSDPYPWSIGPAYSTPDTIDEIDSNDALYISRTEFAQATRLAEVADGDGLLPYGWVISMPDAEHVVSRGIPPGGTLGGALATLVRTGGGMVMVDGEGRLLVRAASTTRSPSNGGATFNAYMTAGDDDLGQYVFRRGVDDNPTRVTASWPLGSVTHVDEARESVNGARREESIDTMALEVGGARAAAAWRSGGQTALRLRSFSVDCVTAVGNFYPLLASIRIGQRWRVAGIPSEYTGASHLDVHVEGWAVEINDRAATLDLETSPAGPEWRLDDADLRAGTPSDAVLSVAMTVGDTSMTFTSSAPLTTDAGAYPMHLDVQGERVIAPNAPASATSPQTLTGLTRGWPPGYARAHTIGERVDIWDAPRVLI